MSGNGSNKFSIYGKDKHDKEPKDVINIIHSSDGSNISQTTSPSVSVSAQIPPGAPIETDTTGHGVSGQNLCHVRADGQAVRAEFGMSTSPTSATPPCQDLQTKSTPSDQQFSNQCNMMPRQVLPVGEGRLQSHSSQSDSQDKERCRVHCDSLTKSQSADGNDKLHDAMDISMRGSTAGGDDKWEGLLQVTNVTNSRDDMNDVDMEEDNERISESRKSDQMIADARDYNAEGAKPKSEPGQETPPPWKEFVIMILNSEDKRVLEKEKISHELQPMKMQYLLHCQMEVLLRKIRIDFQALKMRNFKVEKEMLVISISKLTDEKIIPKIVNLLHEEVEEYVKVKMLSTQALQFAPTELQVYVQNGDIALYCEEDKIFLVGKTEVIDGLASHLSQMKKKSTQPPKFCHEIKLPTPFDAHLFQYFGIESFIFSKYPAVTCFVNEEQSMIILSGDKDQVIKAEEEVYKFGKSFQRRELSVTPSRIQLLGLKEIQIYLEKILEKQNLRLVYKTSPEDCRITVYFKEDSIIEDFQNTLESAFMTPKFPVVGEGSPKPIFATSKIFVAFLDANENKNLVVVRDEKYIRISTTTNFASKIFEMEKVFNTGNDHGDQQTGSDLNKNVAENFPGSSTEMIELKTLKLNQLQFSVLQNLDFISFLHKKIPTCNAELNENAITFNGTQREVEKKMKTFLDYYIDIECVKHVQWKTSQIPDKMLEFVQRENIREYIDEKLKKEDILCYWYSDKDEGYIKLFTLKGLGSKAVTVVQQCLNWEEFTCTADLDEIWKEKNMECFLKEQKSNIMFDFSEEDLVVVGLESCMRNFVDLYHKIFQANAKLEHKQTLNQHKERTDLSPNIFLHLRKYKPKELMEFERKWNVTFKEVNGEVLLVGETSAVQKASDNLKKSSYFEQKWSCQVDKPVDVIKKLSSKSIPHLENQFCCSVFTNVNTSCISHQQLAQWVSHTKDQRIIFVHGSVTDLAADVIVCPVKKSGGPQTFGKIGKAIFQLGGSIMQKEVKEMSRFEEIVISSATGNLPCLMVAYFPVPFFKPGVQMQKEMVKKIQEVLEEVEKTQLQSVVITTDIGNDIPESTFLHWFLNAYKAYQHKLSCINQIYLCTESDNVSPLLSVLKDGFTSCLRMFDFTTMFEQRSGRVSGTQKPADISISLVKGKLIDQKVDVIVNSSNRKLELEKGAVSASILAAAGNGIYTECKQSYPNGMNYGEVVTTKPGNLHCKVICHGCLPHWKPVADISCQILAKLVFGCLLNAESYKSESIAFPVFGTGNLLYPWDEVAKTMISTVYKYGRMFPNTTMKEVRIVLYDKDYNSIEAFEQEKMNMEEVKMRPEDTLPCPSSILECRCKNVRVKIEPLSGVEFHHCQAIVMIFSYQDASELERDEPSSRLKRDKITIERSKTHKFWIISVVVDDQYQTFDQAIRRALIVSEEKRLSTLAISLMIGAGGPKLIKQATSIRNCVDNIEDICYLQVLKMMIANRDDFNKILAETIQKQDLDRRSIQYKVSDWFNVSKTQWKNVKYSETLQSPRLYLTIVGEDEKNMATVLQKITEEITVLKIKGCQNLGASIRSVKTKPEQKGYGWIRTSKNNDKVKLPADVCRQLDEAVKYKLPNAEINEEDGVHIYDFHTKQYTIQGYDTPLGIFTRDADWRSGDSEFTSNISPQKEIQHEDDFGVVTGMINPDLHGQQSLLKQECKRANVLLNNDTFEVEGTLDQILSLNRSLIASSKKKTGVFIQDSHGAVPKKRQSAPQPKQQANDDGQNIIKIEISEIEYEMMKKFYPNSSIFTGFISYKDDILLKYKEKKESDTSIRLSLTENLNKLNALTNFDIQVSKDINIDSNKLQEVNIAVASVSEDIFCYFSYTTRTLSLKGSQYEKLQAAKNKCEFILGIRQQGRGGRGRRQIDTAPDYQSDKRAKSPSSDMNASLGRSTPVTYSSSSSPQDMVYKTPEGLVIRVYVGNILKLNVDCIVNAANENLSHGGGVADVISRAAGYGFQQESDDYIQRHGQLKVTECCKTSAGSLPYQCVIHAVGPKWYDYPHDRRKCASDLQKTIVNCFLEAETQQVNSVALPAISSGIFGVPKEVCCGQYCEAVIDYSVKHSGKSSTLKEIHFMDKDSGMVKMIQDEFGQHLIITNSTKSPDNTNLQNAGKISSQNEKGGLARSLSHDPDAGKVKTRASVDFSQTVKTDNFKCQFIVDNGLKIHVVQEDITKMNVDVVVCPQDGMCQSKGGIAKAIERVSDEQYKKKMYAMRQIDKCEVRRYMASPAVLPFKNVLHAVSPLFDNYAARNRDNFERELALTIRNILRNCSSVSQTMAIPVLGVGVEKNVTPYGIYTSTLAKEILKQLQSEKFMLKEIFIVTHDPGVASTISNNLEGENAFKKVTSFQRQRKRQNKDSTEGQKSDDGNGVKTKSSDKLGTTVREGNLDNCVICMDTPEDPRKLKCGHIFCQGCIGQHFKLNNPVCPTCGSIQGELTGNQPPATMKVYRLSPSLSGYPRCGRIVIDYDIPGGYQGKEHKTPGRWYEGIRRSGFLPDNEKGQLVAKMLRIAFDRKLVFTIGDSRTTGKQGVVTWNDIHHKTNPNPHGPFGYPDETYLDRVIDELSAKGVTEKDVGPDTKLY